jgi:hypothetical protein
MRFEGRRSIVCLMARMDVATQATALPIVRSFPTTTEFEAATVPEVATVNQGGFSDCIDQLYSWNFD